MSQIVVQIKKYKYLFLIFLTGIVYVINSFFILTSYNIFILILSIALLFSIYVLKTKEINMFLFSTYSIFMLEVIIYFTIAYLNGFNKSIQNNRTPLLGYYTSRTDGIAFKFKGRAVNRPFALTKEIYIKKEDQSKNYIVDISVVKCLDDCYLIKKITLIKK